MQIIDLECSQHLLIIVDPFICQNEHVASQAQSVLTKVLSGVAGGFARFLEEMVLREASHHFHKFWHPSTV